jgi:hypothetical protein
MIIPAQPRIGKFLTLEPASPLPETDQEKIGRNDHAALTIKTILNMDI